MDERYRAIKCGFHDDKNNGTILGLSTSTIKYSLSREHLRTWVVLGFFGPISLCLNVKTKAKCFLKKKKKKSYFYI